MSAHTLGPLTVRVGSNGDVGIIATGHSVVANDDIGGALVAECYCEIRRAGEGAHAEALANATLYATSPELLDALVAAEERDEQNQSFAEVEKLFQSGGMAIKSEFDYEYYRRLKQRAAIAKATGQQGGETS